MDNNHIMTNLYVINSRQVDRLYNIGFKDHIQHVSLPQLYIYIQYIYIQYIYTHVSYILRSYSSPIQIYHFLEGPRTDGFLGLSGNRVSLKFRSSLYGSL